jgi:hypothetical protein
MTNLWNDFWGISVKPSNFRAPREQILNVLNFSQNISNRCRSFKMLQGFDMAINFRKLSTNLFLYSLRFHETNLQGLDPVADAAARMMEKYLRKRKMGNDISEYDKHDAASLVLPFHRRLQRFRGQFT